MSQPEISVVMPCARVDAYLGVALGSLLEQTDVDLEVVLVLDGVPWQADLIPRDDRLVIHEQLVRQGTAASLNAGIRRARADLIGRLDADDVALPGRLRRQCDHLRRHPEIVCLATRARVVDRSGHPLGVSPPVSGSIERDLLRRNPIVHSSVVYRRAAFDAAGGYDEACVRMQDYDLWLRMAQIGDIRALDDVLTDYRVHPGQHSRMTPPWSASFGTVLRSRRRLARHLGSSAVGQLARDAVWAVAQLLRHLGVRRPRHLTYPQI